LNVQNLWQDAAAISAVFAAISYLACRVFWKKSSSALAGCGSQCTGCPSAGDSMNPLGNEGRGIEGRGNEGPSRELIPIEQLGGRIKR